MFCGTRAWEGMVCGYLEPERVCNATQCNAQAFAISRSCLWRLGCSWEVLFYVFGHDTRLLSMESGSLMFSASFGI